jgi:hypothetical protein
MHNVIDSYTFEGRQAIRELLFSSGHNRARINVEARTQAEQGQGVGRVGQGGKPQSRRGLRRGER